MFFVNLALIVTLMAIAAAIEAFLPLFGRGESNTGDSKKGRVRANLSLTTVVFAFNWILYFGDCDRRIEVEAGRSARNDEDPDRD
jgi:hypothetical protein